MAFQQFLTSVWWYNDNQTTRCLQSQTLKTVPWNDMIVVLIDISIKLVCEMQKMSSLVTISTETPQERSEYSNFWYLAD